MPRAIWKGHLKIAELACPVALYAGASTQDRVSFRTVNRATGNPVRREYVDEVSGKPVAAEDQVKGYETEKDRYIVLTAEDLARANPENNKILDVEAFLERPEIDTSYFDKPYYLAPASRDAHAAFALVREGMRDSNTAALARATLFRRVRTVLIRPQGAGLVGHTLHFDYEVRAAGAVFRSVPDVEIENEMLDLARHIIKTKSGSFDPAAFDDRYDAALAELVRAKAEGRAIPKPAKPAEPKVVNLLDALRQSAKGAAAAGKAEGGTGKRAGTRSQSAPKRKAG